MLPEVLSEDALFAGLEGEGADFTVVTPNRRLAQWLSAEFDRRQITTKRSVWDAPDILPLSAFLERTHAEALYDDAAGPVAQTLTEFEERSLWEDAVRRTATGGTLLAVPQTAALARDAWQTAHAWQLWPAIVRARARRELNDDARAFLDWAGDVQAALRRGQWIDAAVLPDWIAEKTLCVRTGAVRQFVRWGFDVLTPQQAAFFECVTRAGGEVRAGAPAPRRAHAVRTACADARAEFHAAAAWARARLEANAAARIGIVVPSLAEHRDSIRRALALALVPGCADPCTPPHAFPFNLSLGEPLENTPPIAHALRLLELLGPEIDYADARRVLRSPFIAGAGTEYSERAALDAALAARSGLRTSLDRVIELLPRAEEARAPVLVRMLATLAEFRRTRLFGTQTPRAWSVAFGDALALAGFPGERALDSVEYQTLQKWHALLAEFARLDRVVARIGFADALARLRRMAAATLFQPETPDVPIQVLGVLESAGMMFDHLWVTGLTDEGWPAPARANPFLPIAVQRAAGVPNASPAAALEFSRRMSAGWLAAAEEVVFSHPMRAGDRALAPSPLLAQLAAGTPDIEGPARWSARMRTGAALERVADSRAPPVADPVVGGASVLRDQAACPFRALAIHRLGAEPVSAPHPGLDAMERGILVHRVLATVWRRLETRAALEATSTASLATLLNEAADEALAWQRRERPSALDDRLARIERVRLARITREWLEVERVRAEFRVAAIEDKRRLPLGPLLFDVRLDRVDEAATGERIVIDYKTGRPSSSSLLGSRPAEPQLPLYATFAEPDAVAAAFAQVRAGDMRFTGIARDGGIIPGLRTPADANRGKGPGDWAAQRTWWRTELLRLAQGHGEGEAEVDPADGPGTCRGCEVRALCRIDERRNELQWADKSDTQD